MSNNKPKRRECAKCGKLLAAPYTGTISWEAVLTYCEPCWKKHSNKWLAREYYPASTIDI